uniref:Uncharacterized protein n=1 Tax=Opuntia streptacantha TaxID=393608 RepID=A0A7C8YSC9_OPUST
MFFLLLLRDCHHLVGYCHILLKSANVELNFTLGLQIGFHFHSFFFIHGLQSFNYHLLATLESKAELLFHRGNNNFLYFFWFSKFFMSHKCYTTFFRMCT